MSNFRGYKMKVRYGEFVFADTGRSVAETWRNRPCGYCGQYNTPEGHDGCLGTLPEVINACCGHGQPAEAYVQFTSGEIIHGVMAREFIKMLLATSSPRHPEPSAQ